MNNQDKQKNEKNNLIKSSVKLIMILVILILMYIIIIMTVFATTKSSNLAFTDYKFYAMESTAHSNVAHKGDLVIVRNRHEDYKLGDAFVYGGKDVYYCDEVEEVRTENIVNKILIAQDESVKYKISDKDVEGKVVFIIPYLGYIVWFLRTPLGIILFVICTICLFVFLRYLFVNNKQDEKETTDEENYSNMNN